MKNIQRSRLQFLGLPEINSLEDISLHTHLSKGLIFKFLQDAERQYLSYTIPKSSGGQRHIHQPSFELKALQRWILRSILDRLSVSSASKGFEPRQSTLHNAAPHVGAKSMLCVDIDDFFPSIPAGKVWFVFSMVGYSESVAAMLTTLTTYEGHLPQGAPTSPKLANLVCWRLDKRLMGYAGRRRVIYTRYADDMCFSSQVDTKLTKCLPFIRYVIKDEGFTLNEAKTRFAGPSRRHEVTGLVVTDQRAGIGRTDCRKLRALMYRAFTSKPDQLDNKVASKLRGHLAYVHGVDHKRYERLRAYIDRLKSEKPQPSLSDL